MNNRLMVMNTDIPIHMDLTDERYSYLVKSGIMVVVNIIGTLSVNDLFIHDDCIPSILYIKSPRRRGVTKLFRLHNWEFSILSDDTLLVFTYKHLNQSKKEYLYVKVEIPVSKFTDLGYIGIEHHDFPD